MRYIKVRTLSFGSLFKIMMMPTIVFTSIGIILIVATYNNIDLYHRGAFIGSLSKVIFLLIGFTLLVPLCGVINAIWMTLNIKYGFWIWGKFSTIKLAYEGNIFSIVMRTNEDGHSIKIFPKIIKKQLKIKKLSFLSLIKIFNMDQISLLIYSVSYIIIYTITNLIKKEYQNIIMDIGGLITGFLMVLCITTVIYIFLAAMAKLGFWIYNKFSTEPMTITYYESLTATTPKLTTLQIIDK